MLHEYRDTIGHARLHLRQHPTKIFLQFGFTMEAKQEEISSYLPTPADADYFKFPFVPYDIQYEFMRNLYEAIEHRNIAILESPTGTVSYYRGHLANKSHYGKSTL